SRRRHTRFSRDWSSDVCSSDLISLWGFIWIWVGLAVVIVTFQYGANGVEGGISLPLVMLVVLTATMALAVIMTMTADIGTEHGRSEERRVGKERRPQGGRGELR